MSTKTTKAKKAPPGAAGRPPRGEGKGAVLVTGAGSGIGAAIATALAAEGFDLLLVGRRTGPLEETLGGIPGPGRHRVAGADVTDPESLRRAYAALGVGEADLRGVVANAGLGGPNRYGKGDRWAEVLATNLTGTYNTVEEALPHLVPGAREGYSQVLIVSSVLAHLGVPGYSAYCAAKAGLLGLMRSWAAALAPKRVLVNAVCPGWVDTAMAREGIEAFAKATRQSYDQALAAQMSAVPLAKMTQPAELGALAAFLFSGRQTSITGAVLDVNNGSVMRG